MDLTADQSTRIKKFIQDWTADSRMELETTFGVGGVVDSTTFLQIAQRLRAKGFKPHAQEDRLNIITPSHIRFTLEGLGVLQSYCKDDSLTNKTFTAMIKDRAASNSNVDIDEYDMRFKMRREEELGRDHPRVVEMLKKWTRERKAFRLIRRWSFEGKGVRMDLSMVRQSITAQDKGEYSWSTSFLEKNILQQLPRYEVEVELLRDEHTATPELALKALISGVGEVLRAIQKNTLLLRKSVANTIRTEYYELVRGQKFRGVGPVTLETKNISREVNELAVNIRTGFNVTDKADGLRAMGFVSSTGELYMVDQSLNIYRTGLQNKDCSGSLLDGEWVTLTKDEKPVNHFLLFDIYYAPDAEMVSQLPFATFKDNVREIEAKSRYNTLKEWFATWSKNVTVVAKGITDVNRLAIAIKEFYFAPPGDTIFTSGCSAVLDTPRIYHTDGLIITSNSEPLPEGLGVRFEHQFKWKPARDNTVDFLISFEKDIDFPTLDKIHTTEYPITHEIIQYKTMRLYVGGKKSKEEANPRETILQQQPLIKENEKPSQYRPVLFHPTDYPDSMANTCHVAITTDPETYEDYAVTEDSKEPIRHNSIVEMRYDSRRESGWRWIPSRIRHDKTERLQRAIANVKDGSIKYSGMMNDENVGNSVWNSIHDPITESMIRSGKEEPTEKEIKEMMPDAVNADEEAKADLAGVKYYERKAPKENLALIRGLQDFHNKYIKNEILLKRALLGFNKSVVDLACGKAGDLYKWVTNHAGRVLGIDYAADNITNPVDGAYRRYMDFLREGRSRKPAKMAFVIGNSSKSLVDGTAGATPEERDMLRSIFGRAEPEGPIPPYIQSQMAGSFRGGADVASCMFALHYFFENKTSLDGFIENVGNIVKIGGYFIGCCFDGQKVFELLQGTQKGETKTGLENDIPIWSIAKEYDADYLTEDDESIGLGIEVNFISIGMTHKEYIVPFELLKKKLAHVGFRLLNQAELAEINLENSTATFDQSYTMAQASPDAKLGGKSKFFMPDAVKDFSFLNRWFIFKRQGITEAEMAVSAADIPAEAMNKHFNIGITKYNKSYARFSIVSSSPYSVLKPWEKKSVNDAFRKWFQPSKGIKRIIDATAHIGVDTINMSNQFPNAMIDAFEIVPETYEALVKNIIKFDKQTRIRAHNQDITTWEPMGVIDFLYVDPPWGGKNYDKEESIDLFLQKEDNEQNAAKNVNALIDAWIESGRIKSVVMKAPKNFNKTYLTSKYKIEEEQVLNRMKEVAYTLILIRAPLIKTDILEEAVPLETVEAVRADLEEKKDEDLLTMLRDPTRVYKDKDIFIFGPSVALRDSLKVKGRSPISISIAPERTGRWLSLSTPFPIPDRELKGKDGQPILYPTMEHYMAAMKYEHASNHPDLVIPLFSTLGNIHQRFIVKRREKRVVYGSGTPDDYKMLEDEIQEVKEKMTKAFTDKQRVVFDDAKWNRPIRADDPLSMRDRILQDALAYRWEQDDNFRKIIEEVREQRKYLLYNIGSDSDKSEWAGKLEIAGPMKGRIMGENRIGFFIMELAQFA